MTLSVSATVTSSAPPTVLVSVASSPAVADYLVLWRIHEDGSQHQVLSDRRMVLNGTWQGYDYHAPTNQAFYYTAQSASLSADSASAWIVSDEFWLIHSMDSDLSVQVEKVLGPQQTVSLAARAQKIYVLGNPNPIIRSSTPRGESGKLVIQVTRDDLPAARSLLSDGSPVLMNGPWGQQDLGWAWIYPSDVSVVNSGGFIDFPTRNIELAYEVCTEPDADLAPAWTYADARAEFSGTTYAALRASGLFDSYSAFRLHIETP